MTPQEFAEFLKRAFDAYLRASDEAACEPLRGHLPFNAVSLEGLKWGPLGQEVVLEELRELTNQLNAWLSALRRWHAWQMVTCSMGEDDRWQVEHEFVTLLATYCLFQPCALRDALTLVITNGLHQLLKALDPAYTGRLPLDRDPWGAPSFHTRRRKERQLSELLGRFPAGKALLADLCRLDDKATREATSDFRNRASHSIAPHFSVGVTQIVTRSIERAERLEAQGDGTVQLVPVPGQTSVCYSVGGSGPLDMEQMRQLSVAQFEIAVRCLEQYQGLLRSAAA